MYRGYYQSTTKSYAAKRLAKHNKVLCGRSFVREGRVLWSEYSRKRPIKVGRARG